jgi:hypothetical protein
VGGQNTYSFSFGSLLERVNLNHWTTLVSITTAIKIPETRLCQWEITGKCTIIIVIKQAQT